MPSQSIKTIVFLFILTITNGSFAMSYPEFKCVYERDTNPTLDIEAEKWFQEARHLEKINGIKNWPEIVSLYDKAINKNHWKAMHNMAALYRTGWPGQPGVEKDTTKMIDLYKRMLELDVPLGYYNWAVIAEHGQGIFKSNKMASSYMYRAAQMGSPLAQARIGQYFAFELPRKDQDDATAEQYYSCAGAQEEISSILQTASFYKIAKNNYPRALFYLQHAAELGSSRAITHLKEAFNSEADSLYNYTYAIDIDEYNFYDSLEQKISLNPNQKFPNLTKERPLPKHPLYGYDREHPDRRPEL